MRELCAGEAGPDVARPPKQAPFRSVLVKADGQRPEVLPQRFRVGPAADDELLPPRQLDLQPERRASAGIVRRRRVLGEEPLPAQTQRAIVEALALACRHLAEPDELRAGVADDLLQPRLAVDEREPAEILRPVTEDVERDEGHGRRAGLNADVAVGRQVDAAGQALEADGLATPVEGHDLAIEEDGAPQRLSKRFQRADDVGKLRGLVVAEPRTQRDARKRLAWLDDRQDAHPVVL